MRLGPEHALVMNLLSKYHNITMQKINVLKLHLHKNLNLCMYRFQETVCDFVYKLVIFDGDIISFYYDISDRNIDRNDDVSLCLLLTWHLAPGCSEMLNSLPTPWKWAEHYLLTWCIMVFNEIVRIFMGGRDIYNLNILTHFRNLTRHFTYILW